MSDMQRINELGESLRKQLEETGGLAHTYVLAGDFLAIWMEKESLKAGCSAPSRDYAALFEYLCAGHRAVGFVDYDAASGNARDVVMIQRRKAYDIFIGVRGVTYGSLYPFEEKYGPEQQVFQERCASLNLEWLKWDAENESLKQAAARWRWVKAKMPTFFENLQARKGGYDNAGNLRITAEEAVDLAIKESESE